MVGKTSALHFSLPCYSFVFQTILESALVSVRSVFFFRIRLFHRLHTMNVCLTSGLYLRNTKTRTNSVWSDIVKRFVNLLGLFVILSKIAVWPANCKSASETCSMSQIPLRWCVYFLSLLPNNFSIHTQIAKYTSPSSTELLDCFMACPPKH